MADSVGHDGVRKATRVMSPPDCGSHQGHTLCPEVSKALSGVMLIAEQKKRMEESTRVSFKSFLIFQIFVRNIFLIFYFSAKCFFPGKMESRV